MISFRRYSDPDKARKVYREYKEEIAFYDLRNQAEQAVEDSRNSVELDARLDLLLAQVKSGARVFTTSSIATIIRALEKRRPQPSHEEDDGYYSNALKSLEESA